MSGFFFNNIDSIAIHTSGKDNSQMASPTTSPPSAAPAPFHTPPNNLTQDVEGQRNQTNQHKRTNNRHNHRKKVARANITTQAASAQFPALFCSEWTDVWVVDGS